MVSIKKHNQFQQRCNWLPGLLLATFAAILQAPPALSADDQVTGSTGSPAQLTLSLDALQAELAKRYNCDVSTYFEFCDDAGPNSGVSAQTKFKHWTQDDKDKVLSVLQRIFKTAPGLVISAGSMDKVHLFKAEHLQVVKYGSEKNFADVPGVSLISGIALAENFLDRKDQYEFLLHELTHRADFGGHMCYTKEWCDFAAPKIAKYRLQNQLMSQKESWRFDRRLRRTNRWPSLYGTENVQEAFAEYVTAFIHPDGFSVDPTFKDKFARRLLVPNEADLMWAHHVRRGTLEYQHKNIDLAITQLQEAAKIDSKNPYVHDYLALCYLAKDDLSDGLAQADETLNLFDAANVPRWDSTRISAELVQISLLHNAEKYADEKEKLDQILVQLPNDSDSYSRRAYCLEKLGQLSAAASDLYEANRHSSTRAFNPFASDVEPSIKETLIDQFVETLPRSDWALRLRGHYKELLADKEVDAFRKNILYLSALEDVENSLGSNDCSETSGLVQCAQIRLKLEDSDGAKRDILSALALDPEAIEAHVFCIRLYETIGETESARKEFDLVKQMIYSPLVGISRSGIFEAANVVLPMPKDPAQELQHFLNGKGRRLTGIDIGRFDSVMLGKYGSAVSSLSN